MEFALALLAAAAQPLPTDQTATIFTMTSTDGEAFVCADLIEAKQLTEWQARQWILGFWSGLNVAFGVSGVAPDDVGKSTTSSGIMGEIKALCSRQPAQPLPEAVRDVYLRMRNSGL